MSDCPTCGLRQWRYSEDTLTCKNGHRFPADAAVPPKRQIPVWAMSVSFLAGFAADLLLRTIT